VGELVELGREPVIRERPDELDRTNAQVVVPAQFGVVPIPQRCVREGPHRHGVQAVVEFWDAQQLEAMRRAPAVTSRQRDGRCQSRAGALAGHAQPLEIDPQLGGVRPCPQQCGVAVVEAGRERMLGGQPVVHRH
jgi:hypothetical protein